MSGVGGPFRTLMVERLGTYRITSTGIPSPPVLDDREQLLVDEEDEVLGFGELRQGRDLVLPDGGDAADGVGFPNRQATTW
ncbi:hypothetical protein [Streptomyces sp. NPDC048192]|uniref:hypothetical protein n=1 Tax=Streptomyces sp. NPDC048192 TaxID=3365510 RepID=UPI0037203A05